MKDVPPDEYYGSLARVRFEDDRAVLRFHQFVFDDNCSAKPVYEVVFHQPSFGSDDIGGFLKQEVEFSRISQPAQLHDIYARQTLDLVAAGSVAEWQPYDLEDYRDRVTQLNLLNTQLHHDLRDIRGRFFKAQSTAIELLRRAEIKAAGSAEFQRLQKPAIEVLQRILTDLE